jgi:hypothetical protein
VLQVKSSGEMVTDLDLPRQKPYECLLLGFIPPEAAATADSEVQYFKNRIFFVSYVNEVKK